MQTRVVQAIAEIPGDAWNALLTDGNPFLRHEFLLALETTGCASPATGWHPCHVICENADGTLAGALPLYLKTNPYGEFVFDYAWAGAYERAGLQYYPKLVSSVPFTPVTGPRLLCAPHDTPTAAALIQAAQDIATRNGLSSWHVLFPDAAALRRLTDAKLLARKDCQFHWQNHGYRDFDEFLATFTAVKHKKVRRERRRIMEAGIRFRTLTGATLTAADWEAIMPLYASTFLQRGREPYLDRAFFEQVSATLPEHILVFAGYRDGDLTGVAICFRSDTHLYGRYWGADGFVDSLHFETCYYQGIDYCIREGLQTFEPGTQGEHKISRGFVPTETWSAHWLSRPEFAAAIDDYLAHERDHVNRYIDVLGEHVPYKRVSGEAE